MAQVKAQDDHAARMASGLLASDLFARFSALLLSTGGWVWLRTKAVRGITGAVVVHLSLQQPGASLRWKRRATTAASA